MSLETRHELKWYAGGLIISGQVLYSKLSYIQSIFIGVSNRNNMCPLTSDISSCRCARRNKMEPS